VRVVRAAVLRRLGAPVAVEDLTLADTGPGEVLVRVTAAGVCHSDLHVRDGTWARPTPVAMGHEGAGVVEEVGAGVDPSLVGRQVVLSWQVACRACAGCRAGRPWACTDSPSYSHRRGDGSAAYRAADGTDVLSYCAIATMSEATVIAAAAAIPLAEEVDPAVGALIGCCVSTGVGAVTRAAEVEAGASVVIIGLGGVGLSCVMGAVLARAGRVVAVDRQPAKLELAGELGATDVILAAEDPVRTRAEVFAQLGSAGADYAFEAAGRAVTATLAVDLLAPGGLAVMVGMPPMDHRASFEVYRLVDGNRRIIGTNYGNTDPEHDFPAYAELYRAGRLPIERLVERRLDLADVEDAFDRLRVGTVGRQVIVMDSGS
jgi:Zn-dependent alcohol dehydrogenase